MKDFELARPSSADETIKYLSGTKPTETVLLAGGQDVISLVKDYVLRPDRLVSLRGLPLNKIEIGAGGSLTLGAMVTLSELAENPQVQRGWPVLAHAAGEAATPQIRNLGTVGGNLNQRPRCWYYRSESLVCMRKGGDKCLAVDGDNRYHAVFGEGPCHNPNMSSLAGPLLALGATVEIAGAKGRRTVPLDGLFDPYSGDIHVDTNLAQDDVILRVQVPAQGALKVAHEEVRYRRSQDWPLSMCTVSLALAGGNVREAKVVLGAVATSPLLSKPAAAALAGKPVTVQTAQAAAEAAVKDAQPLSMNAYKVAITRNLVRRVILAAAGVTG